MGKACYSNKIKRRPKKKQKVEADRVSDLPDELLCHVLSFLPSRDSAATSLLSSRWKSLWKKVPVLDLVNDPNKPIKRFSSMVNKIVCQRESLSLTRVRIKNPDKRTHPEHVHKWVSTALDGNVEHLNLSLFCLSKSAWPHNLFTNGTLVTLKLKGLFDLTVPSHVSLPSLKALHLTVNSTVNNDLLDSVPRLLSGCPVLETFRMNLVSFPGESFHIRVPTLKHLSIKSFNSPVRKIEINTPCLESLVVDGFDNVQDYVLGDLTHVVDANINIHISDHLDDYDPEKMLKNLNEISAMFKLLRALINVQTLSIPDFKDENMRVGPSAIISLPQFDHLVRLQLKHRYGSMYFYLEELLGKCPRLKELVMDKVSSFSGPYWQRVDPSKISPDCLSSGLTLFEQRKYHKNDLPLISHVLNTANVLKVVKIQTDPWMSGSQQKFQVLQQISKLPRISSDCVFE